MSKSPQPSQQPTSASVDITLQDSKNKALSHAALRVELPEKDKKESMLLFQGRADAKGKVTIQVPLSTTTDGKIPKLHLRVFDLEKDIEQDIPPTDQRTLIIKLNVQKTDEGFAELLDGAHSDTLRELFSSEGINSLAVLREKSNLKILDADKQVFADLQAHAQLQLVSRDHKTNQALIQAGYRSVFDIVRQSRSTFSGLMKDANITNPERIYDIARRQASILNNMYTEVQTRANNGMSTLPQYSTVALPEPSCECDCDSAVSPQAYLVDLLDYAVDHVFLDANLVTLPELEEKFGQPFAALPVDCAFASTPVRQIRLCIEVLHRKKPEPAKLKSALAEHSNRAYDALLTALGTSYRELRLARSDADAQKKLGKRLGVADTYLERFRLEPDSDEERRRDEDGLEREFGLQGTRRDQLSTCPKFKDVAGQITRWQLWGVRWHTNTDNLGIIYVTLAGAEIMLYKDSTREDKNLVAKGTFTDSTVPVLLQTQNNSGLTGRFEINNMQSNSEIYLVVVPEWLARRKNYLRERWKEIDQPASNYTGLLIDPDLIDESEVMQPADNLARQLWSVRKTELQTLRETLNSKETIVKMMDEVSRIVPNPWAPSAPELSAFLNELATRDPHNVKADEREKALDILVNVYKGSKFGQWRSEEQANKITFSHQFFLIVEKEPVLNPLRASADARLKWRAELESNIVPPLIDPDILSVGNFATDDAMAIWEARLAIVGDGQPADASYRVNGTLFEVIASITTVDKLNKALTNTELPTGAGAAALFHPIGFKPDELIAIDKAFTDGSTLPITPAQYGLTVAELLKLFEVRRLGGNADNSDWEQVRHILVQVEKRRYLYPQWRAEEAAKETFLTPDVFRLPPDGPINPILNRTLGFLQWRWDARHLRDWCNQLENRIEQDRAVETELQTAIEAAEDASLPTLRDDLVKAAILNGAGASLEERKRWVMNHLLINAFEDSCRKTTRVAQAIETIQLLLWGIDSGHFEDKRYSLERPKDAATPIPSPFAPAATFAEEWRWLGSYATWRSAMFTYLYPENLLLPELRRPIDNPDTDPTKLFQAILKIISGEVLPPSAAEISDPTTDIPLDDENDELNPIVADIFRMLDKTAPQTLNGQRKIHNRFLGSNRFIYGYQEGVSIITGASINDWENQWFAIKENIRYNSTSAFLEDILYIPLAFALAQWKDGHFEDALYWFGVVYNFQKTPPSGSQGWANRRLELYFQQRIADDEISYTGFDRWFEDLLNPHRIAATRTGADARFVILSIIRCLLDYAESEFAADTPESLARARELYETVRRLLYSEALLGKASNCPDVIGMLVSEVGEGKYIEVVQAEIDTLRSLSINPDAWGDEITKKLVKSLKPIIADGPPKSRVEMRQKIRDVLASYHTPQLPKTVAQASTNGEDGVKATYQKLLADPKAFLKVQRVGVTASFFFASGDITPVRGWAPIKPAVVRVPAPNEFKFCIPRNPLITILRLRYESGWFKLNHCMNLAGQRREVPAYAAPTDTSTGLVIAEVGSTAGFSATARFGPTLYRYRVLIERAKQLVGLAQQAEATYLSFLEKRDQEAYNILQARQGLGIARANVMLQDLRVTEAEHGIKLVGYQFDRVEQSLTHYDNLLQADLLKEENDALAYLDWTIKIQAGVAAAKGALLIGAGLVAGGAGAIAGAIASAAVDPTVYGGITGALSSLSSLSSMQASFERRRQEWEFQKALAEIDKKIADAQKTLANDHLEITQQEKRIAEMSAENASDVVNFLNTKFTSVELYTWMGGIIGGIYRYLLQEATSIAKLAQRQLAFERQENELTMVLDDYWTYTQSSAILLGESGSSERRGMTGSARLLQDITRLDQEAFLTDRRKLQLSKTFSLALHDPVAFARFRESGVLTFSTALEQFDRSFPGHYLRLIKRVRVSVFALVPPTEGIRATLESAGVSRVVRGGDTFVETEIRRDPERIAFTAPINATGLFELQEQPEMLLPFEGTGVAATGWKFTMPRPANAVDYSTIADVLLIIDYTALESDIYRSQVIQRLDRTMSGERPFSFRYQLADCWYDLNNSDLVENDRQFRVTFETHRSDFPPNLADLRIQHVSLYFARQDGFTEEINVEHLLFTEIGHAGAVGGAATTQNGLVSTREASVTGWLSILGTSAQSKQPIGTWELKLKQDTDPENERLKALFKNEQIEDIIFVITYTGTTSAWPV